MQEHSMPDGTMMKGKDMPSGATMKETSKGMSDMPKKGMKKTMWTVMLTIVGLIVLGSILFVVFVFGGSNAPVKVARQGVTLLEQDKVDAFYQLTSSEFRQKTSLADLKKFLPGYPILTDIQSFKITSRQVNAASGKPKEVVVIGTVRDSKGTTATLQINLIERDKAWQIEGFGVKDIKPKS